MLKLVGSRSIGWLACGLIFAAAASFVEYAIALFIQLLLVSVNLVEPPALPAFLQPFTNLDIKATCGILVVIGALRMFANINIQHGCQYFQHAFNARLRLILSFKLLRNKQGTPLSNSRVNAMLSEDFPKASTFAFQLGNGASLGIQLLLLVVAMFVVAWKEASIGVLGLGIIAIVARYFNSKMRPVAARVPKELGILAQGIYRVTKNLLFIRVSNTGAEESRDLNDSVVNYFNLSLKTTVLNAISAGVPPFLGVTLIATIVFLGQAHFATKGAVVLTFLYLFTRFVQLLGLFVHNYGLLISNYPQFKNSLEILAGLSDAEIQQAMEPTWAFADIIKRRPKAPEEHPRQSAIQQLGYPPAINLQNVSFSWTQGHESVFKDFNLQVAAGSVLAVVGESGSGKSTLLLLILNILKPNQGTIAIDGQTPQAFFDAYSDAVAYVGPEPFLIKGSIKDNLLYGLRDEKSDQDMWQALAKARIDEEIKKLGGLAYSITEEAHGLSTGQKQRIALARSLLKKPSLLILDEATANLDPKAEGEITDLLISLKGSITTILVSHKAELLRAADVVVDLPKVRAKRLA